MSLLISNPIGSALLRAACVAPGDDTPRLVLADWLEENGEALRAEFIRTQCQLAEKGWTTGKAQVEKHTCDMNPEYAPRINRPLCRECMTVLRLDKREKEILAAVWASDQRLHLPRVMKGPYSLTGPVDAWRFIDDGPMFPSGASLHPHKVYDEFAPEISVWLSTEGAYARFTFRRGLAAAFAGPSKVWKEYGRMLVGLYPLEEVTLTDKEPMFFEEGSAVHFPGEYTWWDYEEGGSLTPESDVGKEAFAELTGVKMPHSPGSCCDYPSKEEARNNLSDACLKVARKQAGLPPL